MDTRLLKTSIKCMKLHCLASSGECFSLPATKIGSRIGQTQSGTSAGSTMNEAVIAPETGV
jgi:hypothetical protein